MEKVLEVAITQEFEKYIYILKHEIKNPVLAQIQALECLVKSADFELKAYQKELLELTLASCQKQCEIINFLIMTLNFRRKVIFPVCGWVNIVELIGNLIGDGVIFTRSKSDINVFMDKEKFCLAIKFLLSEMLRQKMSNEFVEVSLFEVSNSILLKFIVSIERGKEISGVDFSEYKEIGALVKKELFMEIIKSHGWQLKESINNGKWYIEINLGEKNI